jgi:hypothetical protein
VSQKPATCAGIIDAQATAKKLLGDASATRQARVRQERHDHSTGTVGITHDVAAR